MRLYRILLHLFPRQFRTRFGEDMAAVFLTRWHVAKRQGWIPLLALTIRTAADLCIHAAAERRSSRPLRRQFPARVESLVRMVAHDVRFAARSWARRPGFTAVALITLALGIAANTAIFSVVRPLLLETPPFPDAGRVVRIYEASKTRPDRLSVASPANFDAWEKRTDLFVALAGFSGTGATLTGAGDPERLKLATVTPSYFDVFGVRPALGRPFAKEEVEAGAPVIVLSDALWRRRFGADRAVLQTGIMLDGRRWQVVGIMPADFLHVTTDGWVPLHLTPALRANRNTWFLGVAGRLREGVTPEAAQTAVDATLAQLATAHPGFNRNVMSRVIPWQEDTARFVRRGLWLLQGVAVIVLLIAGSNLANLLLAQVAGRTREFVVRMALGAGRRRVIAQLVTEGVVLAATGGLAGGLLAVWMVPAIAALAPSWLPRAESLSVGMWDLLLGIALAMVTGALFSLVPALLVTRGHDGSHLLTTRGATAGRRQQRVRSVLVGVQVSLALVLLSGAALLVRSFDRLTAQPIGFDSARVLTAELTLPPLSYGSADKRRQLVSDLMEALSGQPGVVSVAASTALPFTWWEWMDEFAVLGRAEVTSINPAYRIVTPGYFDTMQIPVVRGRTFEQNDTFGSPRVALVNEQFVREHASLGDVFALTLARDDPERAPIRIVGVVGDTRHRSFERPAQAELYLPAAQWSPPAVTLAVRTVGDPMLAAPIVRRALRAFDPDLPIAEVKPLDAWVSAAVAERRFYMVLLGLFSALAAILAAVGIYGVMAYVVRLRAREISIRIALGASAMRVERLMIRQGMFPVVCGVIVGGVGAWFATGLLRDQLFQIGARDPGTMVSVTAAVLATGVAACWVPSRRTSRVDPARVLQTDV